MDGPWAGGYQVAKAHELVAIEVAGIGYQSGLQLADMVQQAVAEMNRGAARQLQMLAEIMARGMASNEIAAAHQRLGRLGQQAVLNSYAQVVTRRKRAPSYRTSARSPMNRRYAGGALRRALAAKDFFEADRNGIRFINITRLDKEARHWARLNAGAGSRGAGSMRTFQVRFGNMVVASLGIDMEGRPAFMLPRGYWWGEGGPVAGSMSRRGDDQFFPMGEGPRSGARSYLVGANAEGRRVRVPMQRRRISKGIEARNFLDAGVGAIARNMGPVYDRLLADIWKQGTSGPRAHLRVAVRPRAGRWTTRTFRGSYGGFSTRVA